MRGVGNHENDALVLIRRQFRFGEVEKDRNQAQHDHGEHQHHRPGVEGAMKQALVAALEAFENHVQAMGQAAGVLVVTQQKRTHHRRQGQGDDTGNHHRAGQGQGELLEQRPGQAGQEADRCIHRRQGDGHRNHRHGDFPGAFNGGLERCLAFLDVTVNVFHHHDGIVHHQADGQYHRQQGEQVDRVPHHLHEEHDADHRQRDGHHRDHHRAQGTEEQEHHHDHDQHRFEQGFHHFVDRGLDEQGGVVGDFTLEVRR
ncbi:hypothetical protein D3C71_983770 [compost metagenome]